MSRHWARAVVVATVAFWPLAAYGYIDPGSGLLLVQGLISVLVGGLFVARRAIRAAVTWAAHAVGLGRTPVEPTERRDDLHPR